MSINFLLKNIFFYSYREQLQIISSAEVYLAGRPRAPHIYPHILLPGSRSWASNPHQGGGMFIDHLFMVINIHKEFFSNSL